MSKNALEAYDLNFEIEILLTKPDVRKLYQASTAIRKLYLFARNETRRVLKDAGWDPEGRLWSSLSLDAASERKLEVAFSCAHGGVQAAMWALARPLYTWPTWFREAVGLSDARLKEDPARAALLSSAHAVFKRVKRRGATWSLPNTVAGRAAHLTLLGALLAVKAGVDLPRIDGENECREFPLGPFGPAWGILMVPFRPIQCLLPVKLGGAYPVAPDSVQWLFPRGTSGARDWAVIQNEELTRGHEDPWSSPTRYGLPSVGGFLYGNLIVRRELQQDDGDKPQFGVSVCGNDFPKFFV